MTDKSNCREGIVKLSFDDVIDSLFETKKFVNDCRVDHPGAYSGWQGGGGGGTGVGQAAEQGVGQGGRDYSSTV
jgi:hypothetical protein